MSSLDLPTKNTLMVYADDNRLVGSDKLEALADHYGIKREVIHGAGHPFHGRLGTLKRH